MLAVERSPYPPFKVISLGSCFQMQLMTPKTEKWILNLGKYLELEGNNSNKEKKGKTIRHFFCEIEVEDFRFWVSGLCQFQWDDDPTLWNDQTCGYDCSNYIGTTKLWPTQWRPISWSGPLNCWVGGPSLTQFIYESCWKALSTFKMFSASHLITFFCHWFFFLWEFLSKLLSELCPNL